MSISEVMIEKTEALIDPEEVLRLSRELIRVPSIFTQEEAISKFIVERLERWGFSPKTVKVEGHGPDVVADIGDKHHPSVVLNGHMDTVEVMSGWKHDPHGAKVEGGMLYGLGALDMKCGLAAMMLSFRALQESGLVKSFRVTFQAVSGEEHNGEGTRALIAHGAFRGARAVIVGEGFGGLKALTNARRGGSYYDIDVLGKSAHGATPERGINAVEDASRIVCALSEMKLREARGIVADDFEPLRETQTVLRISGGTGSLSVPDKCSIRLVRCTVPGKKADVSDDIMAVIRGLSLESKVSLRFNKSPLDLYHPYSTDAQSLLVRVARESAMHHTGELPRLVCGLSEADDNVISHDLNLPVICMGPGETGAHARYHQPEEAISTRQLGTAARIFCRTILSLGSRM